ncbi:MAG: DUF1657 domain-containing protein [Syntrophomonadaceae bacterium]|jgi:hypothetical protein|nr:DUF1657 domain-containing protein [Syntrophomonadaceae bacterium]
MTVGSQVKQTVASLKGVKATLETFASLQTYNDSQTMLNNSCETLNSVIGSLETRIAELEMEEPQYKGL